MRKTPRRPERNMEIARGGWRALRILTEELARIALRGILPLASLVVLASCLAIPLPNRNRPSPTQALTWKVVAERREPNLLFAVDRTVCEVPPDRFERVLEGERLFCDWR